MIKNWDNEYFIYYHTAIIIQWAFQPLQHIQVPSGLSAHITYMIIEIPFGIKGANTRSALIPDVDYNLAFSTMIFKSSAFFISPHKCIVRNLVGLAASEFFANQSIIFLISFSTKKSFA